MVQKNLSLFPASKHLDMIMVLMLLLLLLSEILQFSEPSNLLLLLAPVKSGKKEFHYGSEPFTSNRIIEAGFRAGVWHIG